MPSKKPRRDNRIRPPRPTKSEKARDESDKRLEQEEECNCTLYGLDIGPHILETEAEKVLHQAWIDKKAASARARMERNLEAFSSDANDIIDAPSSLDDIQLEARKTWPEPPPGANTGCERELHNVNDQTSPGTNKPGMKRNRSALSRDEASRENSPINIEEFPQPRSELERAMAETDDMALLMEAFGMTEDETQVPPRNRRRKCIPLLESSQT